MNYNNIYNNIIKRAKERDLSVGYFEKHHIVPKCLGGQNDKNNIVNLTPEEHFVCHQLLVKIYPRNRSILHAANMMCTKNNNQTRNNKLYGWIRRKLERRVTFTCCVCNKEKSIRNSRWESEKPKYCSIKCYRATTKQETTIQSCKNCKNKFTVVVRKCESKKLFCCLKCNYEYKHKNAFNILTCAYCKKEFSRSKDRISENNYCSKDCFKAYKKEHSYAEVICKVCGETRRIIKSEYKRSGIPTKCKQCYIFKRKV